MSIIKLNDYLHFVNLTNEFDSMHNTNTYIAKLTLEDTNNIFLKRNIQKKIAGDIHSIFKHSTLVYSNNATIDTDSIVKLYSFFRILDDLKKGCKLLHPLNIHYFKNKKVALHPGQTRLSFLGQYTDKVDVIITDYSNTVISDFNDVSFNDISTAEFNCNDLYFLSSTAITHPRSIRNAAEQEIVYKECINIKNNSWALTLELDPIVKFELKNKAVYVNDSCVLYKRKTKWMFDV